MSFVPDVVAGSGGAVAGVGVAGGVAGAAASGFAAGFAGVDFAGAGFAGAGFGGTAAGLADGFAGSGVVRNVEVYSRTGGPQEVDLSEVRAGGLMVGIIAPRSPGVTVDVGA